MSRSFSGATSPAPVAPDHAHRLALAERHDDEVPGAQRPGPRARCSRRRRPAAAAAARAPSGRGVFHRLRARRRSLLGLWLRGGIARNCGSSATSEPLAIGVVYMKFFVDTADVAEIKDLAATGLLDGVTTNPSLIAKSGRPMLDVIKEICAIVPGPVSAEVATDHKTMLAEGRKLAKLAKNVAVKVPLTPDGLKTCKALTAEGTMVNVTLCFSAAQALLAAKAGATFISPFVGRLDDIGQDGMQLIARDHDDLPPVSALQDRGAGRLGPPHPARDRRRPSSAPMSPPCRPPCCASSSSTR